MSGHKRMNRKFSCVRRVLHSGFDYKNGKIVYNEKDIDAKEEVILVIVDQYYFASYFECLKTKKVDLLFLNYSEMWQQII